jgi:hypothetical protein
MAAEYQVCAGDWPRTGAEGQTNNAKMQPGGPVVQGIGRLIGKNESLASMTTNLQRVADRPGESKAIGASW